MPANAAAAALTANRPTSSPCWRRDGKCRAASGCAWASQRQATRRRQRGPRNDPLPHERRRKRERQDEPQDAALHEQRQDRGERPEAPVPRRVERARGEQQQRAPGVVAADDAVLVEREVAEDEQALEQAA